MSNLADGKDPKPASAKKMAGQDLNTGKKSLTKTKKVMTSDGFMPKRKK